MSQPSTIPQKLMTAALLHFTQGVPIADCDCLPDQRKRLARVSHVYWLWKQNPFLDYFAMFKQLVKGKYSAPSNEYIAAQSDKRLFDFVVEHVTPSSRQQDEARVRYVANREMQVGMETENFFIANEGAKLLTKVARLDQPEAEQADMTKVMFLPPVVTTQVTDVDPNKAPVTDEQTLAIINKYQAHQDGKRLAIEERVNKMLAKREASEITDEEDDDS